MKLSKIIHTLLMALVFTAMPTFVFAASGSKDNNNVKYILFAGIAIAAVIDLTRELKRRK